MIHRLRGVATEAPAAVQLVRWLALLALTAVGTWAGDRLGRPWIGLPIGVAALLTGRRFARLGVPPPVLELDTDLVLRDPTLPGPLHLRPDDVQAVTRWRRTDGTLVRLDTAHSTWWLDLLGPPSPDDPDLATLDARLGGLFGWRRWRVLSDDVAPHTPLHDPGGQVQAWLHTHGASRPARLRLWPAPAVAVVGPPTAPPDDHLLLHGARWQHGEHTGLITEIDVYAAKRPGDGHPGLVLAVHPDLRVFVPTWNVPPDAPVAPAEAAAPMAELAPLLAQLQALDATLAAGAATL